MLHDRCYFRNGRAGAGPNFGASTARVAYQRDQIRLAVGLDWPRHDNSARRRIRERERDFVRLAGDGWTHDCAAEPTRLRASYAGRSRRPQRRQREPRLATHGLVCCFEVLDANKRVCSEPSASDSGAGTGRLLSVHGITKCLYCLRQSYCKARAAGNFSLRTRVCS